ncbi:hypothetical protein KAI78_08785 [bacterium]|nr:hypothetical protein [bacterium]
MKMRNLMRVMILLLVLVTFLSCGDKEGDSYVMDDSSVTTAAAMGISALPLKDAVSYIRFSENTMNYGEGMVVSGYAEVVYTLQYTGISDSGNAIIEVKLNSVDLSIPQQNDTFEYSSEEEADEDKLGKDALFGYNILLSKTAKMEYHPEKGWVSVLNWEELFDYGRTKFMLFPAKEDQYREGFLYVVSQIADIPFVERKDAAPGSPFKVISRSPIEDGLDMVFEYLFKPVSNDRKKAVYKLSGSVVENAVFSTTDQGVKIDVDLSDTTFSGEIVFDLKTGVMKEWKYKVKGTRNMTYSKDDKTQSFSIKYDDVVSVKIQ